MLYALNLYIDLWQLFLKKKKLEKKSSVVLEFIIFP